MVPRPLFASKYSVYKLNILSNNLNKNAYCQDGVIKIQVEVRNQSSIDVSGVSFTVSYNLSQLLL